jgi:CHAT domain-containing protein
LKGKSYWHFSSHGQFDWNDVRKSALLMRDAERLTVGRLLETEGSLGHPRLVALSACETGLYDIERNPDEFIGLPATFMQIGAVGVVASLWQVDDLATALLMAKFYDLHLEEGLPPPSALKGAQGWLRQATKAELLAYSKVAAGKAKLDPAKLADLQETFISRGRSESRFAPIWETLHANNAPQDQPRPGRRTTEQTLSSKPFKHPYYWGGFVYTGL